MLLEGLECRAERAQGGVFDCDVMTNRHSEESSHTVSHFLEPWHRHQCNPASAIIAIAISHTQGQEGPRYNCPYFGQDIFKGSRNSYR